MVVCGTMAGTGSDTGFPMEDITRGNQHEYGDWIRSWPYVCVGSCMVCSLAGFKPSSVGFEESSGKTCKGYQAKTEEFEWKCYCR